MHNRELLTAHKKKKKKQEPHKRATFRRTKRRVREKRSGEWTKKRIKGDKSRHKKNERKYRNVGSY